MITDINIIMMAHKYQPSSKDQAHHTDTTLTPHYILKCSVVWDCGCGVVRRHRGLCSYRVRGVDGSRATHLTVESYTVVMLLTFILIIISITSPPDSSIPGLQPSFSANPSHRSLPFLLQDRLHGFAICLPILLSISVFSFQFFCFSTF